MYIDLIILLILLILVIIFCKKLQFSIFYFVTVDLILRVLAFIKNNININNVTSFISKYLPESIFDMIDKYTSDIDLLNLVLKWAYIVILIIFIGYMIKIFYKKKRI